MKIGLRFDKSSAGQVEGINDAGIETFAGDHLGSLAREQGQNSLDAKKPNATGPVEVSYHLLQIKNADVPGANELAKAVRSAETFWSEDGRHDDKTLQILKRAKGMLKESSIPVLRIADRNTTGLRGSGQVLKGDWFSLTKAAGVSLKGKGKGGSYGIGKNVFWLNSKLRSVYFATKDMDGLAAFQGVVKLVSHPMDDGEISRAVGFYGEVEGFKPILKVAGIPVAFRCDEEGTNIFIAGFDPEGDWKDALRAAFAENFFVALHTDLLRVSIEKTEISSANIAQVVEDLAKRLPDKYSDLKNYFDALTAPEAKEFEHQFPKLGKVRLRLLVRDGAKKRIAMFRGTGMRIFERKNFRTPVEFAGVFQCQDDKGNEYLRKLEPPSHNAWEPERSDDPEAATVIDVLYGWLRQCVSELNPFTMQDRLEVPGLEKYLPDDSDEIFDSNAAKGEGDPKAAAPKVLEGKTRLPRAPQVPGTEPGGGGEHKGGKSTKKKKKSETDGKAVDTDFRIFKVPDSKSYAMRFRVPNRGVFSITLASVGDDGRAESVLPLKPELFAGKKGEKLKTSGSKIGPLKFRKAGLVELRFGLDSVVPLSLTARVNEH
ncbi:MAG TPA: hypothetical protein VM099_16335 [Gemmatimonadaceae bacterium]|nr:hypothetical protein [Gemmatimonadaceae bacterium]